MIRKSFAILGLLVLVQLNACNTVKGTATGASRDIKAIYHYGSCVLDWDKDCRVLGVATWQTQWLDEVGMKHHTGIYERLDRVYEGRRIRPQKGFGEQ